MIKSILITLILLLSLNVSSAGDIEFVTGEDNLVIRSDNTFVPESDLKIDVTRPTMNHYAYRIIAMDYMMTIKDPHDNIVFVDILKDRSRSYESESNVLFTKIIPADWINGEYIVTIHTYDRVDYSMTYRLNNMGVDVYETDNAIEEMSQFYNTPSDSVLENLEVLKSRSYASVEKFKLEFFVDDTSDPCKIQNVILSHDLIAEDSYVSLFIIAENTARHRSPCCFSVLLNNETVKEFNVSMNAGEVRTIPYEIIKPPIGLNTIEVNNKLLTFNVSGSPLGAIELSYLDMFTDDSKLYTNEPFNMSVVVMNTGDEGKEVIHIRSDDTEVSKEVRLEYGERKVIEFELTFNNSGTHKVEVTGTDLSKVLFVQESDAPIEKIEEEKDDDNLFYLIGLIIIAGALIFMSLLLITKYRPGKEVVELPDRTELQSLVGMGK